MQEDLGAGLNILGKGTGSLDSEVAARSWWVGIEVDLFNGKDVIGGIGAVLATVLAKNCELVFGNRTCKYSP